MRYFLPQKSQQGFKAVVPRVVHNSVEPVSDGEHCAVSELTPNRLLNEFISFQVHRGRRFIENQDLTFTEQRTR